MRDQATRVLRRKSKEEILAEMDAEDALEEAASRARAAAAVAVTTAALPEAHAPIPDPTGADEPIVRPAQASGDLTLELDPTSAEVIPLGTPVPEPPPPPPPVVAEAPAPLPTYHPAEGDRALWAEVVEGLVREAAGQPGRFVAAAHLAWARLGDNAAATGLLDRAAAAGADDAAYWRERAVVATAAGDAPRASEAWRHYASKVEDKAGVEALVEAARAARDLAGEEAWVSTLVAMRARLGDDATLLALLREAWHRGNAREQEAEVLAALARLHRGPAEGAAAAMMLHERADLLERDLNRPAEAEAAVRAALEVDPADAGAFLHLERYYRSQGDAARLASLYQAEAARLAAATAPAAEVAWWHARAARVYRGSLQDEARAAEAFRAAVSAAPASAELRQEYHAFLEETQRWEDLVASLAEEAAAAPEHARSFPLYLRARVLEDRLGRTDEALADYRVAATDPAGAPAAEAVLRILQARGDGQGLVSFLSDRLARLSDPSLMVTVLYRMGETCEGVLQDQAGARKHYEAVLDVAPGYLPALEGLERVYSRLQAWAELAAIYEQRALLAEDPNTIALQRHRAGTVYELRIGNLDKAVDQYRLALEAVADFPASLDAFVRAMELRGDWAGLARALRAAAESTKDGNESVSLFYRAGRVLSDRTTDIAGAMACLRRSLELSPAFLPAVLLLKELAAREGDWSEYFRLERSQADFADDVDRRHWRLFAAAEAAQRLPEADPGQLVREVLREDPAHPGAVALAARQLSAAGDAAGLATVYTQLAGASQDEGAKARALVRAAEIAAEQGDGAALAARVNELAALHAERPLRGLARTAEAIGQPESAVRMVEQLGDRHELARLKQAALGDVDGAAALVGPMLAEGADERAAVLALRSTRDRATLAAAHRVLAENAADASVRAMHASTAALLSGAAGQPEAALRMWQLAFDADPRVGRPFEGLRAAAIQQKDVAALAALHARLPAADQAGLGDALEEAGDLAGAAQAWKAQMASAADPLPWSVRLERAYTGLGEWKALFDLLHARMQGGSDAGRDALSAKCRWLLAEKLGETDEAQAFYEKLHAERPDDPEVLGALARIASARGDTTAAVAFLDQLATASGDPALAARVQRQRGDVLEAAGDVDGARAAFARALDHVHDDAEALAGLRRLAERAGDWQAVVALIARQAALSHGPDQVARFAEIARIWEEKMNAPAVAADAWRKVRDLDPGNVEALRHLLAFAEAGRDWKAWLSAAESLLPRLAGAEATALRRRMAEVLADTFRREDDALRLLEAATTGPDADVEACRMMERIYQGRNDWERVVEALTRRAAASGDSAVRVEALLRAARIRRDTLHDKAGAADLERRVLEIDPQNGDALRGRATWLYDQKDDTAAAELYARLEPLEAERDLDDFDAQIEAALFYFQFADILSRLGRGAEAVPRLERALELNPTHLPSLEAIGPVYIQREEWARAEKVYRQLLQLTGGLGNNEQLARVYTNLGLVEIKVGQAERARKRFTKALELRPNDVAALKGLGMVLAMQEDWNNLLNIYNNIIYHTHEPGDVTDAYLRKGHVLDARLHLPEKAQQHYEKSLAFDPAQPLTLLRLGELALRRQDWPEAASLAERGLQIETVSASLKAGLLLVRAIAYQACGDDRAAGEGFAAAVAADDEVGKAMSGRSIADWPAAHDYVRGRIAAGTTW